MKKKGAERRQIVRIPLDAPYFANLQVVGGKLLSVMLLDLSRGGMQVGVAPNQADAMRLLGHNVVISELPHLLDNIGSGCSGQIVWVSPQRCGIRLDRLFPLTDWQITAIAHEL